MSENLTPPDDSDFSIEAIIKNEDTVEAKKSEEIAREIFDGLKKDLQEQKIREKIINIPLIEQSGGTDCAIACLRMVLTYLTDKYKDTGFENFIELSKDCYGIEFRTVKGVYGDSGFEGDSLSISRFIERSKKDYDIQMKDLSKKEQYHELLKALKHQQPILMGVDFHVLHPDYERDIKRSHMVLIKGYRLDENDEIKLVVNDPKPKVGGELEISQQQLAKAIENMSMTILFKE